ncbi:MAG: hypothetical protein WCB36_10625, partial [Burkholderiales bacterium]
VDKNVPVVTVELKHAIDPPSAKELDRMWQDLMEWIDKRLLKSNIKTTDSSEVPVANEKNEVADKADSATKSPAKIAAKAAMQRQ